MAGGSGMNIDSLAPALGCIFVFMAFMILLVGLAVIGFAIWVVIGVAIDTYQERKRRPMATRMPLDEIKARRLERAVKGRQDTIKAANP
jgi:sulfite exporter TauE/SafE